MCGITFQEKGKLAKKSFHFKKTDTFSSEFVPRTPFNTAKDSASNKTPLMAFLEYLNDETFRTIADLANQYHTQNTGKDLGATSSEIKRFVCNKPHHGTCEHKKDPYVLGKILKYLLLPMYSQEHVFF